MARGHISDRADRGAAVYDGYAVLLRNLAPRRPKWRSTAHHLGIHQLTHPPNVAVCTVKQINSDVHSAHVQMLTLKHLDGLKRLLLSNHCSCSPCTDLTSLVARNTFSCWKCTARPKSLPTLCRPSCTRPKSTVGGTDTWASMSRMSSWTYE